MVGRRAKRRVKEMHEVIVPIPTFKDTIAPTHIRFHPGYVNWNEELRKIVGIINYPIYKKDIGTYSKLFSMRGTITTMFCESISNQAFGNAIRKHYNKNASHSKDAKASDALDLGLESIHIEKTIERLSNNQPSIYNVSTFVQASGKTKQELDTNIQKIAATLKHGMQVDNLHYEQKNAFNTLLPINISASIAPLIHRNMPSDSLASFLGFTQSGKYDPNGIYLGNDTSGGQIWVDLFNRDVNNGGTANGNYFIVGNSGEGKTFLQSKVISFLFLTNVKVFVMDIEDEYGDLTKNLGGKNIKLGKENMINILEVRQFGVYEKENDEFEEQVPIALRKTNALSGHISFLRDFFQIYKPISFTERRLDILEIILEKLYNNFHIDYETNLQELKSTDYPIISDLYDLVEKSKSNITVEDLYTVEDLKEIQLALRSMSAGSDSFYFNGHTTITDANLMNFNIHEILTQSKNKQNAIQFNILTYIWSMVSQRQWLIAFIIDELYKLIDEDNILILNYLREMEKRFRKYGAILGKATQNTDDMLLPKIKEKSKALFSISSHKFIFNLGDVDINEAQKLLQLTDGEYEAIKFSDRGKCIYRSGNERYHLSVAKIGYEEEVFGTRSGNN
jgi:Domain of unknown function DUF87.